MNIVYVLSGTTMSGGATKAFLGILEIVCGNGHKAFVVCPDNKGVYEYLKNSNPIPGATPYQLSYTYDTLPFVSSKKDIILFLPRLVKRFAKNRLAAAKLKKFCSDIGADLIHTNTSVNNIGYLAAKKLHIKHIWHIREYGDKDFNMIVPFQRKKLNAPDNYKIAITKDILNYKGLDRDMTSRVIYDGPVKEIRPPATTDGRYFFFAGRLTEKKGVFDLLDGYISYAEKSGDKALPLKLAGRADDDIQKKLTDIVQNNRLSEKVQILGEITDSSELRNLYRNSTATIVPSWNEGFGFVLPEAMSCGALTVGRDSGGTKEQYDNAMVITGEEVGFRFNTARELADILTTLASSSKKDFLQMITNSQRVVEKLYTVAASGGNVLKFYEEITGKS